ncbi:PAS domain-containing sensor histidine kinase [Pseudodesulfovibrio piezophilus]|uniref:histidine kinase n=1 Tax=Pseudodesulfovibrio piezophilus (strain DSM 21447 / JCM 15486 / C1TLV30) TaxID=1322246 RepID=M1WX86_PSEP2|nr:PAS domain-containing sensor histidine kinase [Pseudodesulfovibrio piezophilus]CCH49588.1 protein of unknown function [Pseudodesulfovibrio piezophilus C1TLV30]
MTAKEKNAQTKLERALAKAEARIRELESRLKLENSNDMPGAELSVEQRAALQDHVFSSMKSVPFFCRNTGEYDLLYIGVSVEVVTGLSMTLFYEDPSLWQSRIHSEDRDRVLGRFRRLGETRVTRCEYRWQIADSSYRWFCMTLRLVPCDEFGDDGTECVAGVFWDINGRKMTEKALLEREERYRTVANFTHDWEFWLGPHGMFLYISPSFERVTGYKPEKLKEDPSLLFETIVHPQDRGAVRRALLGSLESDEPISLDFRIITRSGDVRWIGHVSQPVWDDKGDPLGRRASNRDITGLKETMQELRDKNQFIDAIMDNSPAAIYAKDVDGRYLFVNVRFTEKMHRPDHELLGKTDFGMFRNDLAEQFQEGDKVVLKTRQPLFEEITVPNGEKTEHWTSTKFPLLSAEGNILGVCGISLDVTDWREAEVRLRQLARAVEQSPVSIAMTDTAGRIFSVNPCFASTSGYSEEEMVGRKLGFMLTDEDELFYDQVWECVRGGEEWLGEVRNRTKSGDVLWERCSISPVRDRHGVVENFVVVKSDITERKRLERLEKDVERIVRHDLKSPIMSFIWVPRTLRKAENITEEQRLLLGDMEQAAHRLLRMVNLSLDLFKMEEGTYEFAPEDLNILRVIQNVMVDLGETLDRLQVSISIYIDGRPAEENECLLVQGEELLCHSMLANLVKNAVEASEAGDRVTIHCSTDEEMSIAVHNKAVVPDDIRESFFEKYVTSGKRFGTGLGTYSARLIALTQGGRIEMKSTAESGTTVTVSFPARPCLAGGTMF